MLPPKPVCCGWRKPVDCGCSPPVELNADGDVAPVVVLALLVPVALTDIEPNWDMKSFVPLGDDFESRANADAMSAMADPLPLPPGADD